MLLAGLMALHVGAFCVWTAAGTAEALAAAGPLARALRLWALSAMAVSLAAGAASMGLAYPYYAGEGWLWAKAGAALGLVLVQSLRAAGRLGPAAYLKSLGGLSAAALLLSFARPF